MTQSQHLSVIILAAGQGTRMKSALPKVLHPLASKPLLQHVLDTAAALQPSACHVIYGHGGDRVKQKIISSKINWVEQSQQLGTGHAVAQALPCLADEHLVLILYGDVPLIKQQTLAELVQHAEQHLSLLTVHLDNPQGYGRIVRDSHAKVVQIVEEKDADSQQKAISEVNTGIMALQAKHLKKWISQLNNNNAQKEYYLTDIIAMAVADGVEVFTIHPDDESEVMGVNSRNQLAQLERIYQLQQAEKLMSAGVTLADPARFDLRGELETGQDVSIDINVILEGHVKLGNNVQIGANVVIKNSTIDDGVEILPNSVIEDAIIGQCSRVGPFARLRPGAELSAETHIGNFVEIKNSQIGLGSKVNHLSYVGDSSVGSKVNIGAGTITANYDGANKHRTTIEDNASIGSNSVLVAPVKIGKGATLGAGTILRKDAPDNQLTMTVASQKSINGWKRPTKKEK